MVIKLQIKSCVLSDPSNRAVAHDDERMQQRRVRDYDFGPNTLAVLHPHPYEVPVHVRWKADSA